MKYLTLVLGSMLGLVVPLGFILACSLILDRPVTIFVVGIVFGFSATYALSILTEGRNVEPIMTPDRWNVVVPTLVMFSSVALIVCGVYLFVSGEVDYLLYRNVPYVAAAVIFMPGALVGCGAILCVLAGLAYVSEIQRRTLEKERA